MERLTLYFFALVFSTVLTLALYVGAELSK
jgi:hypothetical protein